ncbi:hypothetical protein LSAT2_010451, partial [Lamellibrachia satsuma]
RTCLKKTENRMKLAIVAVTLLLLQASLLTVADLIVEDLADDVVDGSGSGIDGSGSSSTSVQSTTTQTSSTTTTTMRTTTTTRKQNLRKCYVCGHYDDNMKLESECGAEKTTYNKEVCLSGSECWLCKKCCTTDLCNSGKLILNNDAPKFVPGFYLFTLVTAVTTFLLA